MIIGVNMRLLRVFIACKLHCCIVSPWSDIDVDSCDLSDFAEEAQREFRRRAQSIVAGT